MKARNTLFAVLMLSPASDFSRNIQKCHRYVYLGFVTGIYGYMKDMYDNDAAVNESDPDKAFLVKGMVAHHEGAIVMVYTELKYGKDPK